MINENLFRSICRGEFGGIETLAFSEALKNNPDQDRITVYFQDSSRITVSRKEAEYYAAIAKEEARPEAELIFYIKPTMRKWVKNNRKKMCERLIKALETYHEEHKGVTIVWEIETPDKIPIEIVKKYLKWYNEK